jgi:hypothetical protein
MPPRGNHRICWLAFSRLNSTHCAVPSVVAIKIGCLQRRAVAYSLISPDHPAMQVSSCCRIVRYRRLAEREQILQYVISVSDQPNLSAGQKEATTSAISMTLHNNQIVVLHANRACWVAAY